MGRLAAATSGSASTLHSPGSTRRSAMPSVDWDLAVSTGSRLVKPGPLIGRAEAAEVVRELDRVAVVAEEHVRELTGMRAPGAVEPADVVDRPTWIAAAAYSMRVLLPDGAEAGNGSASQRFAGRAAGLQMGAALAFLGSRVLGQYDPFGGDGDRPGRLLLVAPNIVAVQRGLRVPAADFRMWVCLHEATHRVQFTAVPWLAEHFATQVRELIESADPGNDPKALGKALARFPDALKAAKRDGVRDSTDLFTLFASPEQRVLLDKLVALSTLLEGHADHVMDAVGPSVVPSVELIRSRFTARREGGRLSERVLRALLGMEAKLRQYAQGAAFTRHVVDAIGMTRFNTVWTSPDTLPTMSEIADPAAWLRRVEPA